ncbi:putative TIM-barrel fold metal-dependent hydrolase [Nonomuraea fuscirosea]|uniref:Putative TIM-barrel fold metal-dependent hydrolase n=1 Tax=Nonomuraea fuscirosea TaxID=1291556 RepID=A0A2T0N1Z1_9ACTN|nr:amidohydrolase family protein [Nonomuraea fuscirosea]PRX65957.1 putative TIM-barrel fold metal-dependent hydrolase [Nonomuraea fuscirosea]
MTDPSHHRAGIVDAHHHIWRAADLPWLQGEMVPRIFGPYEPIRRDYPIAEYLAEAAPCGITSSVYVQTNWPLGRALDEVAWLRDVHAETGWPTAVVGSADLFDAGAADVLRRQAALTPLVRGTRLQLHWHERPEFRFAEAPDRMKDATFRRNLATLAELGWLFELQVFPAQMADAADLAGDFPEITFVLVHAGMPVGSDAVAEWTRGMRLLAERPNVVVKLSGQGTFVHRVDRALIERVTATCLDLFGSRRCMWGSNLPIEKLWTDLRTLLTAWQDALAGRTVEEVHDVFTATATRVYRL